MKSPGKCADCKHKDFDVFEELIESLTENKVTDEFKLLLNEVSQNENTQNRSDKKNQEIHHKIHYSACFLV